ncbi:LysR family transcriptional regulator [Alcaligenes sp. SDU_A2]|uniref:LysR family transcriptional regulator n=1 Tax=Alcaligenes sp. SDU_A2 TaxID=3136634 RepID=UPI002C197010|nr:LysR family transcriptional regulator [Alcaligenes faecalis]HRL20290.1 LysR family transcriptional regulator [Alcaligenes sp.]
MDLNQIAVFVKVVQAGSFSAAARLLDLPVSTVSHRVAMLEKRLGQTLLQRTTRRLRLTQAGQIYFEHALSGLEHMLEAESAIHAAAPEPSGVLRVTTPADIGDDMLASIVRRMRSQCPQVDVELLLTNRYVDLVAEGVDVAIRTGPLPDSTLIARPAGVARWVAFASPGYLSDSAPLHDPQALSRHRCLQFTSMGKESWTLHSEQGSMRIPMSQHVVANDISLIQKLALAGDGVALLPLYLCRTACADNKLVRVLPDWHAKIDPIHLVYPQQRFMPPRLRVFIDLALNELEGWLEKV